MSAQYVSDETGKKTAVLLPIEDYERLLEDLQDLAAIAERRDEPTVSHQDLVDAAFLFTIPLVASSIYSIALANDLRLPTNLIFYYIATFLGALLWFISVVVCGRRSRIQQACQEPA